MRGSVEYVDEYIPGIGRVVGVVDRDPRYRIDLSAVTSRGKREGEEMTNTEAAIDYAALARERVANSVAWLDEHARGENAKIPANWRELVDVNQLNMRNASLCVLGQIFSRTNRGEYDSWKSGYTYAIDGLFGSQITESDFAFDVSRGEFEWFAERDAMWNALQDEWVRVLRGEVEPGTVTG